MRRLLYLSVLVGGLLGLTVSAQGPPTNAMNLRVTTDSNNYLSVVGAVAGTQGGVNNLGNTLLRTDSNNYLYVTVAAASSWPIAQTFSGTALGTTSTDGIVISNTTAATSGTTVQISPRLKLRGTAWDTAASETVDFFIETLPATAATPTGTWQLGYSLNGAAATFPLKVTSAGQLLPISNSSAGTPTYAFAAGSTDGVFRPGGNLIGVSLAGVETFRFNGTYLEFIGTNQLAWAQTTIGSGVDVGIARNAAGVLRVSDGSTSIAAILHKLTTVANTTTQSPASTASNTLYTNTGDADGSTITLTNDPIVGTLFSVAVTVAQTITITASAGETLKFGSATCGTSLTSNTIGSGVTIVAASGGSGGIWIAIASTGTWTCNA